jgi:peptidoglycan/xylan/chitin deacetylase (PgdA/CDA1 family)
MSGTSRIEVYCRKRIAQLLSKKLASQTTPTVPIISFTFDDFPQSALTVAGAMLLERGLHGTYYASMSLMGHKSTLGSMYSATDMRTLVSEGHELACHTFSHLNSVSASANDIERDCQRNRIAAAETAGGLQLRNFSFPSGVVTWTAKSTLTSIYQSCRTVEHGINCNPVDLGFLRANPMYSRFRIAEMYKLIEETVNKAGWLILYTHDVREHHSEFGCTPKYFHDVLSAAVASGANIMTVAEAVRRFHCT